jgi:hypothetical protein
MNIGSRRLLLLAMPVFAVVAVACSSEEIANLSPGSIIDAGAATAVADASTAVADAASKASFVPIRANMDDEPAVFLDAIPETDRKCLEEIWGEDRYTAIRSGEEQLNDESLDIFKCMSSETLSRITTGGLLNEVGELTPATLTCVATKLAEGNVAAIAGRIGELEGEPTLEDFAPILTEIIPVSFCLNEDERAVMDGQSQFGSSIETLECLYDGTEAIGLDFSTVFEISPSDYEPSAEYLKVATDCGFPIQETPTSSGTSSGDRTDSSNIPVSPSLDGSIPDVETELIPIPVPAE